MMMVRVAFVCGLVILAGGQATKAGEIRLGEATVEPGQSVTVPLRYSASGKTAVAVASDVRFNTSIFKNPRCSGGSALPANKSVRCGNPSRGVLRLAIFGLNTDPLPSGELATITFDIPATAKPGRYKLRNKPSAADKDGNDFRLTHGHGTVRVAGKK